MAAVDGGDAGGGGWWHDAHSGYGAMQGVLAASACVPMLHARRRSREVSSSIAHPRTAYPSADHFHSLHAPPPIYSPPPPTQPCPFTRRRCCSQARASISLVPCRLLSFASVAAAIAAAAVLSFVPWATTLPITPTGPPRGRRMPDRPFHDSATLFLRFATPSLWPIRAHGPIMRR